MLMNTGDELYESKNGLLTTIAYSLGNDVKYALEGSVFVAGAAIQWLRDGLKLIQSAEETESMANSVADNHEVVMVPAFAGLGAPYWDQNSRGAIFGLTRDTNASHFAKAALDSLAFQTKDVLDAMQKDTDIELEELKVDGGAVSNNYLMQFQSNLLGVPVVKPQVTESTALGAAMMAGYGVGLFNDAKLKSMQAIDKVFEPKWSEEQIKDSYSKWQNAVKRTFNWLGSK